MPIDLTHLQTAEYCITAQGSCDKDCYAYHPDATCLTVDALDCQNVFGPKPFMCLLAGECRCFNSSYCCATGKRTLDCAPVGSCGGGGGGAGGGGGGECDGCYDANHYCDVQFSCCNECGDPPPV